jgi:dipeptidyl aminopeptidase/acylaminoacyl peptidase
VVERDAGESLSAAGYESFPPRYFDKWLDDKRVRLFVMEARAGAPARDLLAGTKLADLPGFGGSQGDEGQSLDAVWTPDGKGVVFSASSNRDQAARAGIFSQLFRVAADGAGEPEKLTDDTHSYSALKFSQDGKWLFTLTQAEDAGKVYDLNRLAAFAWPLKSRTPKILTANLDRSVSRYVLPEGANRVWFTYEHAGLEKLYSAKLDGSDLRDEPSPPTGSIGALAAGGKAVAGVWESAVNPPEIYAFNGAPKRLTAFNVARADSIDWQPVEHFWFKTPDGRNIHNMLVKPPGFDPNKKYPLFAVIHGGAANMWRDQFVIRWNYHLLAKPGYVVLLTDYKGSTGYGEAFARSIQFDPLKGPGDELNQAVDEAIRKYPFVDGQRLAAGGASYGGHLANWLQATTTRYKAIVSHAGEMDLVMQWGTSDSVYGREVNSGGPVWENLPVWREQSPVMQAGNHAKGTGFRTPILITVGELDYRVPINNALMNFATQQRLGTPSKLVVFPDENHWVLKGENSRFFYDEVHGWLKKYL